MGSIDVRSVSPTVLIAKSSSDPLVAEAVASLRSDSYELVLSHQPSADVTITIDSDGQLSTGGVTTLTFTPDDWYKAQTVTFTAIDDAAVEGIHYGRLSHTVTSDDPYYDGLAMGVVDVTIADDESPTLLILQNNGHAQVTETGAEAVLGEGMVLVNSSGNSAQASFGLAEVDELQGNDSVKSAQDLSAARWTTATDPTISNSKAAPHITVNGRGDGSKDYFKFTVTQAMIDAAGSAGIDFWADVDADYAAGDSVYWQSKTNLLKLDQGKTSVLPAAYYTDNYINYRITEAGTYYVEVEGNTNRLSPVWEGVPEGTDYKLHLSLPQQVTTEFDFTQSPLLEDEDATGFANGVGGQVISGEKILN